MRVIVSLIIRAVSGVVRHGSSMLFVYVYVYTHVYAHVPAPKHPEPQLTPAYHARPIAGITNATEQEIITFRLLLFKQH